MKDIQKMRDEVAYFMRRLYAQGLTTTSGGNISCRFGNEILLITPSATDKGRMKASEILSMDFDGKILSGTLPATIESRMHVNIYRARKDVSAIVHAHPVTASAFSAAKVKIDVSLIAESYAVLGKVGYVIYCPMGSVELADAVASAAKSADVLVMRNHGAISFGKNLLQAFDRLEVLEAAARMSLIHAGPLAGKTRRLTEPQLSEIDIMMKR